MRIRARELGGCPLGGTAGKRIGVGRAGQLHITTRIIHARDRGETVGREKPMAHLLASQ